MNKVFVLVELYTFDFAVDYRISVYADRDKATEAFHDKVKEEKEDSWIATTPEDMLIEDYDEDRLKYDAYEDGNAAEYETTIVVLEKEVW